MPRRACRHVAHDTGCAANIVEAEIGDEWARFEKANQWASSGANILMCLAIEEPGLVNMRATEQANFIFDVMSME